MPTWLIVILVIIGLFVLFGGILGVLAIYGMRKYISNAKQAEARNSLGQIAKDAATAFESDDPGSAHHLCSSASAPIPASIASVSGKKYQSSAGEWEADKARNGGFYCLKFELDMPQYYQYNYSSHGAAAPGDGFTATAHGDLNGDGVVSEFTIQGQINAAKTLVVAPSILEKNPEE
jgi:type IV pilus assembly protein PilA